MKHKEKIMNYLRSHGEITVKEMIYELGVTQGATRIKELIEEDHQPITRNEWKEVTRKDGTKTKVRIYRLIKPGQQSMFTRPTKSQIYSQ